MNLYNVTKYKSVTDLKYSGVYLLFRQHKIIYIGSTSHIYKRLRGHNKFHWTEFSFIPVLDDKARAKLEAKLIKEYDPLYNKSYKELPVYTFGTYGNRERRYKAEIELLEEYGQCVSCRQMQRMLRKYYGIIVSHGTVNTDLRKLRQMLV